MAEKMTIEVDRKEAGKKVHCLFRQLPNPNVFGLTERPCAILVSWGSDFCACPSWEYDWHTCPFGGETNQASEKK